MAEPIRRPGAGPFSPRSPLTLDDLTADLTWPRLLRVGRLALRPARLGLGTIYIAGCGVLLSLGNALDGDPDRSLLRAGAGRIAGSFMDFVHGLAGLHINAAANALLDVFVRGPLATAREAGWALLVLPLLLVWTLITGAAICRTAATELAWSRTTSWPEAVAMAIRRWKSLLGAVLVPLIVLWVVTAGMGAAAWALFNLPVLRTVGALAWGLFLFGGLVIAVVALGYLLGHMMLTPAVVCEGADTIDAVQHAYAMGLGRPVRLVTYAVILAVQAVVLGAIVAVVIGAAVLGAQLAGHMGAGDRGDAIIDDSRSAGFVLGDAPTTPAATQDPGSAAIVRVWTMAFVALGYGAAVSYWWCASTGLFLAMRRVCDGQEFSELWSPGMIDGTQAESVTPRAGAGEGKAPGTVAEAVVDNGPADEG